MIDSFFKADPKLYASDNVFELSLLVSDRQQTILYCTEHFRQRGRKNNYHKNYQ